MKRAERRHHRRRIIKKFQRIYKNWDYDNWERNGLITAARGSIGCGCRCCGNPRRFFIDEQLTRPELKINLYYKEWENEHGMDSGY